MIQKIKDIINVSEHIDKLKVDFNSSSESVSKDMSMLKNEINGLKGSVGELQSSQKELLAGLKDDLFVIKSLRKDFEEELYEFKLLKGQMQKQILDKFEEEVKRELNMQMDGLKRDHDSYEKLKAAIAEMNSRIALASAEMAKFSAVGSKIREKDFEMERFARQLIEMDTEKLQLMKKIDTLEKLIGKMRRNQ